MITLQLKAFEKELHDQRVKEKAKKPQKPAMQGAFYGGAGGVSATGVFPSSRVENKFGEGPSRTISSPMVKQVTQLNAD